MLHVLGIFFGILVTLWLLSTIVYWTLESNSYVHIHDAPSLFEIIKSQVKFITNLKLW